MTSKKILDNLDEEIKKYTEKYNEITIENLKFCKIISAACKLEIKIDNDSSLVKLDKEILNKEELYQNPVEQNL